MTTDVPSAVGHNHRASAAQENQIKHRASAAEENLQQNVRPVNSPWPPNASLGSAAGGGKGCGTGGAEVSLAGAEVIGENVECISDSEEEEPDDGELFGGYVLGKRPAACAPASIGRRARR